MVYNDWTAVEDEGERERLREATDPAGRHLFAELVEDHDGDDVHLFKPRDLLTEDERVRVYQHRRAAERNGEECMTEKDDPTPRPRPTEEEIRICLELISRHPAGATEVGPPAKIGVLPGEDRRLVYIDFTDPATLPVGAIYRTWVIDLNGPGEKKASYYRSRRGDNGDDTLPPE